MKQTTTPIDHDFTGNHDPSAPKLVYKSAPAPGIGVALPYDEPSLDYPSTCVYRLPCGICRLLNSQCLKVVEKFEITC